MTSVATLVKKAEELLQVLDSMSADLDRRLLLPVKELRNALEALSSAHIENQSNTMSEAPLRTVDVGLGVLRREADEPTVAALKKRVEQPWHYQVRLGVGTSSERWLPTDTGEPCRFETEAHAHGEARLAVIGAERFPDLHNEPARVVLVPDPPDGDDSDRSPRARALRVQGA